MKCIIRTHVKNAERLRLLNDTIESARAAGFKKIMVIDDQSPLMVDVRVICYRNECDYLLTKGTPGTKNGLYWSLKMDAGEDLHICDDTELAPFEWESLPPSENWGMLSYFAAYGRTPENGWWKYPSPNFYAALACRFHPIIRDLYISQREGVELGIVTETQAQDDILVKELLMSTGREIWNTGWDYAQHTGIGRASTFGDQHNSSYKSQFFIGERSKK